MITRRRVKDPSVEVVIAVALVTAFVAYLFLLPKRTKLDFRPIALILNTVTVFGFLISWFRYAWRRFAFWSTFAVLILLYIGAYLFVLSRIQDWPLSYYILLNPIEMVLFALILRRMVSRNMGSM
jgi:hypothetical protein